MEYRSDAIDIMTNVKPESRHGKYTAHVQPGLKRATGKVRQGKGEIRAERTTEISR